MNDGLREAIEAEVVRYPDMPLTPVLAQNLTSRIHEAVRAFLALPPSEEEIAAFQEAQLAWYGGLKDGRRLTAGSILAGLMASRAVLVPPPEDAR